MTVSSAVDSNTYIATGSDATYTYTFRALSSSDLVVQVMDTTGVISTKTLTTDYTVTGVGNYNGGTITFTAGAITVGYTVVIFRDPAALQTTSLQTQGAYSATAVETALDLVTMVDQAHATQIGRAISTPIFESTATLLPSATLRASKYVGFDASGNVAALSGSMTGVPVETVDQILDTVAQLKALAKPATAVTYLVRGYWAVADGGGGAFAWSSASTATDNGGTVIAAASGGNGRWLRLPVGSAVDVRWFGAKCDGSSHLLSSVFGSLAAAQVVFPQAIALTDEIDWAAIQGAVKGGGTSPVCVYFSAGKYRINRPIALPATPGQAWVGDDCGFSYFTAKAIIQCSGVTGYVINDAAVTGDGVNIGLSLRNLFFDGSNGTYDVTLAGTTCLGVYTNSTGTDSGLLRVYNCKAGFFKSTTAAIFLLNRCFEVLIDHCMLLQCYGYGINANASGGVGTTLRFSDCYIEYCRQAYLFAGDTTDVAIFNTVIENCTTGGAFILTMKALMESVYFENIGNPVGGATTGITIKNGGISFGAGILDGPLDVANYGLNANVDWTNCHFAYLNANAAIKGWAEGAGRGSANGASGGFRFITCGRADSTETRPFFYDETTPSRIGFVYHVEDTTGRTINRLLFLAADIRAVTSGNMNLVYQDGSINYAQVHTGLFRVIGNFSASYTAVPTSGPTGGFVVGDSIVMAGSGAGGLKSEIVCTTAGTPGTWDTLTAVPFSKTASVAQAGTMTFGGTLTETGEVHEWLVTATSDNNTVGYVARVYVMKLSGANAMRVFEDVDAGASAITLTTATDAYTLTMTNSNAFTVIYYAYLLRGRRSHA